MSRVWDRFRPGDLDRLVPELERAAAQGWIGSVPRGIVNARFLCSLWPPPPRDGSLRVVDLGSGGGLPALPALVLRPDAEILLVERNGPRAAFLALALDRLGLSGQGRVVQVDALDDEVRAQRFDVVSARAFGPVAVTAAVACQLASPGTVLVTSAPCSEELPREGAFGFRAWERAAQAGMCAQRARFQGPTPAARSVTAIRRSVRERGST